MFDAVFIERNGKTFSVPLPSECSTKDLQDILLDYNIQIPRWDLQPILEEGEARSVYDEWARVCRVWCDYTSHN